MTGSRARVGDGRTYDRILREAADLASIGGLEGVTIGRLAEALAMSKSGLFAHFGSKEELQLAVVDAARKRFVERVIRPAMESSRGLSRLEALCQKEMDYIAAPEFPGGCFFVMTRAEFHMRPGPVRDAVMTNKRAWRKCLIEAASDAMAQGEIETGTDIEQLAFELEAVLDLPSWSVGDKQLAVELQRVRRAVDRLLASVRAPSRPKPPNDSRRRKRRAA